MLLQGNLREFNLPNIFQLVKMSAKSGALTIRRGDDWGKIFFRRGQIYYAYSVPQHLPLGERLLKSGAITAGQLKEALAAQEKAGGERIGTILLHGGAIDRPTLEQAVREQIQDSAFDFFSWMDGEFEFSADETMPDEDILVHMDVESVIMEGCRRIDEWELIFEQLGSLERVPHLAYNDRIEDRGEVTLTAEEWRVLVRIDGRADMNVILRDCGLDRFHGAKVIYSLFSSGLVTVSEPAIENIGRGLTLAVRGPIDFYNEIFLNTLTDSNLIKQLRVELIDDKEVEIPVIAGQVILGPAAAEEGEPPALELPPGEDVIVFTAAASSPESAWRRLGGESSAWVVLANANDQDSLRASRKDLAFVRSLGDVPMVVAAYMSMAGEEIPLKQIVKSLGTGADVPVLLCHLRDRDSVFAVFREALGLVRGVRPA